MKEKIIDNIRENGLLENCRGLVLCISGGADSMSLLHFFLENKGLYGIPFVVAHVNHGLRAESEEEEKYLKEFCDTRKVPIEILHADISGTKPKGKSTEEYAREVRYDFFNSIRDKYGYTHIATAHNADDNTETMLLNIIRGCGIGGLCGIPVKREDGIIRPLLRCSKKEIYEYCKKNDIVFFTDKTNFENVYTRNIIRNEIIPVIEKINPSFNDSAARLSASASTDDEFLEKLIDVEMEKLSSLTQNSELPLSYFRELHESLLFRVIRRYFFVNSPKIVLTKKQTDDIIYLIKNSDTSKRIILENIEIRRGYDSLRIVPSDTVSGGIYPAELLLGENCLGKTGRIILSEVTVSAENRKNCIMAVSPLVVRSRQTGDRIKLPNRPEKTLKKLFIDDKIPLELRDSTPVVTCGDEVVWISGYGSAEKFRPETGSKAICLEFEPF